MSEGGATKPKQDVFLVAVDFSETSLHAARWAAQLARSLGARMSLLYVLDTSGPAAFAEGHYVMGERLDAVRDHKKWQLVELAEQLSAGGGLVVDHELIEGEPRETIVERGRSADMVVVGTRGLSGLEHLLMGSVAEQVVRTCSTPVLTVHAPAG